MHTQKLGYKYSRQYDNRQKSDNNPKSPLTDDGKIKCGLYNE